MLGIGWTILKGGSCGKKIRVLESFTLFSGFWFAHLEIGGGGGGWVWGYWIYIMNKAMLGKWVWRIENEDVWWQDILREKYLKGKPLSAVKKKPGISHFWQGIMEIKDLFYKHVTKILGNGKDTLFWEDSWIGVDLCVTNFLTFII